MSLLHRHRLLAATAALLAVLVPAAAVGAAPATVSYLGLGPGYADVYNPGTSPEDAGSFRFRVNGQEIRAYCADVTRDLNDTATFSLVPAADSTLPNLGAAGWVAANAATIGTPIADADSEHAAVQLAVWSKTNSITINPTTVSYEPVRTRALALVAAIGTNTVPSGPTSFKGELQWSISGGTANLTAVVTEDDGTPVPNVAVAFTAGSATGSGTTGADGRAAWSTPAPSTSIEVSATATTSIPAGSVIQPSDTSQPLITAQAVPVTLTTKNTIDPAAPTTTTTTTKPAAPTTTAPKGPSAAPTTTAPAPPAEELPYTGASLGLGHLLAALGALGAAGAFVIRMRRRV